MEGRQRVTLYDQMKAGDTSSSRNSLASFLDDVVLTSEISQKRRNQTLLDIIREEEPNNNNTTTKDRKSWKANFKDMLRLKRRNNSDESTHQQQQQQQQNDVVREEDTDNSDPTTLLAGGESSDEDNNEEQETRQVSMSLMDLLEETEVDLDPISDNDGVDEYQKQEEEEAEEGEEEPQGCVVESSVEYNCCVCMVRHKGAAFIPCGHTFCRMCSRELWVSRGNCPLCNNFISEILDIF